MCSTAPSCAIATAAPRAWRAAVTVATQAGRICPSLPHNAVHASRVALAPHPTPPRRPRCPHLPRATSRATKSDGHAAARFCRPIRWASPVRANNRTKQTRRLRGPIRRYKNHSGRTGGTKRMERSIVWNCGSDSRPFFRSRPLDIKNASTSASNTRLRHTWRIFPGGGAEMKGATTSRASSACCAFTAPATAALQCVRRAVVRRTDRTHLTAA